MCQRFTLSQSKDQEVGSTKRARDNRSVPWSGASDCPVHQGTPSQTLHLRENSEALLYNSPDCPVSQRSNGYSAPTVTCYSIKCAPERAEVRHARSGAPDTLQYMSGVPPDIQAGPAVRAPTVRTQRPGDVTDAPDCPVHHATDSLHQTASLVVGVINTPNHPTFKSSTFQPLTRARHSIQDTPK
jgi:hypothetical protein